VVNELEPEDMVIADAGQLGEDISSWTLKCNFMFQFLLVICCLNFEVVGCDVVMSYERCQSVGSYALSNAPGCGALWPPTFPDK
jgi:hypothetical protein